jgi:hypothetical protein
MDTLATGEADPPVFSHRASLMAFEGDCLRTKLVLARMCAIAINFYDCERKYLPWSWPEVGLMLV